MKLSWSNWSKRSGVVILKAIAIIGIVCVISILGKIITGYHHEGSLKGFLGSKFPSFSTHLQLSY